MAQNGKKKNNPAGLLVALLMLLLMTIAIFIVLRSCAAVETVPTPTPAAASASPSEGTETPDETETPTPTATPEPTPTPTEEPSPTPEPTEEPEIDANGSFRSDTGTGLNLVAEWTAAYAGDGNATVTVTLYAESYSLQCSSIYNGGTVVLGGESHSFNTEAVDYDGSAGLAKNSLGSVSVTLPLEEDGGLSIPASASWSFGGTYSGTELGLITADGTISAD
ncbi:MAG: hypothetical protein EOM54_04480 [Clostridia bacterium]|nr:hypothetical protein [Clostridia bacterium]